MPIGEIEYHPYLELGQAILNPTKLILGSFPVYECTNPVTEYKEQRRVAENSIRFFYGSCDSDFWRLYSEFVDNQAVLPPNPEFILNSLTHRGISISDTILSCQRIEFSSEDNHLREKNYNRVGVRELLNRGVTKILCTSKGVMATLQTNILCPYADVVATLNEPLGNALQTRIINQCGGNIMSFKNPIAKAFNYQGHVVEVISIPSPGSPQRQLKHFGFDGDNWLYYASNYFESAFQWLLE